MFAIKFPPTDLEKLSGGIILVKISEYEEKLCNKHRAACRAALGVVGKSDKLVIKQCILAESACCDAHSAVDISVKTCLGTVIFLKIGNELFGRGGKCNAFGKPLVVLPSGKDLFLVLDSATGTLGTKQTKWLKELLATNRTKYRHCIISKHTNLFNTDNTQSTSGNMPFEESFALMELFARHNVTLVLQGHDHYREDLTNNGVRYTVVGTIKDEATEPEYLKVAVSPTGVAYEWVEM